MTTPCNCTTDVRMEKGCQTRFKDAAGLKEHLCSRRAGHEQVGHISDTCGATDQLKVIECNNRSGKLVVECPHCNKGRVEPGIGSCVEIATGRTLLISCRGCRTRFGLNRQAIGNCLDETYLVPIVLLPPESPKS